MNTTFINCQLLSKSVLFIIDGDINEAVVSLLERRNNHNCESLNDLVCKGPPEKCLGSELPTPLMVMVVMMIISKLVYDTWIGFWNNLDSSMS